VESTLPQVLILDELEEDDFHKVVTRMGLNILVEFERPRGGGA
jgi:hypothetical protein